MRIRELFADDTTLVGENGEMEKGVKVVKRVMESMKRGLMKLRRNICNSSVKRRLK